MGIKDLFKKTNNKEENQNQIEQPNLRKMVDDFADWYYENVLKAGRKYAVMQDIQYFQTANDVRNFIEKMAVWYELRYPNYEIERMYSGVSVSGSKVGNKAESIYDRLLWDPSVDDKQKRIDNIMFNENEYVNELCDENSDVRGLEWSEFYNTHAFIKSLPYKERWLLKKPKYNNYISSFMPYMNIDMTSKGTIRNAQNVDKNYVIRDSEFIGLNIVEAAQLFEDRNLEPPERIIDEINLYDDRVKGREELFNCIMYRIIDRGGIEIGPRRALEFAKEFKCNIDIPMMFGMNLYDHELGILIDEYLQVGGKNDLECYEDYFGYLFHKQDTIQMITLNDPRVIGMRKNATTYTAKKAQLYKRLLNVLASQVNSEEFAKEKVKALRLQRNLNKNNPDNNN